MKRMHVAKVVVAHNGSVLLLNEVIMMQYHPASGTCPAVRLKTARI